MQVITCLLSFFVEPDVELVFKALADKTRRLLLDRLHEDDGQTLSQLCDGLDMTRQAATQHLDLLVAANLVSTVRRGREKWHYLNPVPLHDIQERWIDKFEVPRLRTLGAVRRRAEEAMTDKPNYQYVTYIEATPEAVWEALTDADLTGQWWGHRNEADTWDVGGRWAHTGLDGGTGDGGGTVLESDPPHKLVFDWGALDEDDPHMSKVTFTIEPHGEIVRLTVLHEDLMNEEMLRSISGGWPAVLSNLKSLLETGSVLPEVPWEVPA
jgi:uncharacterized protein YndB with AHSA1/START domain/DNA-binding transcriptional ArsR family regulator